MRNTLRVQLSWNSKKFENYYFKTCLGSFEYTLQVVPFSIPQSAPLAKDTIPMTKNRRLVTPKTRADAYNLKPNFNWKNFKNGVKFKKSSMLTFCNKNNSKSWLLRHWNLFETRINEIQTTFIITTKVNRKTIRT